VFFRDRLRAGATLRGVIAVIPSAVATQAMAAAGADFVMVDREHGPIGRESLHAMIAATAGTGCAPLVRVPAIDAAEVKLALDAGAEGVVFPLVRTPADAERCVALMTYPARGRARLGADGRPRPPRHDARALRRGRRPPPDVLRAPRDGWRRSRHAEAILAVDGIDLAILAPFDLSTALGVAGRFDAPAFVDAVAAIERAAAAAASRSAASP
jgi:4-hydroxy-2-oxoheptanedioate aldolase